MRVKSKDRLSNSGFHRCGGNTSGSAHWWLKASGGFFLKVPRVRGDNYFDEELDLSPGVYTLGTGKGIDSIRQQIQVRGIEGLNEDMGEA